MKHRVRTPKERKRSKRFEDLLALGGATMSRYITVRWVVLAGLLLGFSTLLFTGCGGSDSGSSGARLQVALTDSSGTYDQVVLAISAIRVVRNGEGATSTGPRLPLIASFDPAHSVDVLTLSYKQQVLGEATVPVGDYEQVRLVLAPNPSTGPPINYVTLPGDPTKLPLKTPSGQTSGLKIAGNFEVKAGVINAIALDFNPDKAIVTTGSGKFLLKPTGIRIVSMSSILPTYGSLAGVVEPEAVWPSATVYVIPADETVPIAAGSVSPDDGSFRAFLPPGTYTIRVTAPGYDTYDSDALILPVTYDVHLGEDTPVETITLESP